MKHGRILAIHDVSCVGRCSLTVALPIISSVGVECSGLPTAVLSTHTGGFTGYTFRDLTEDMEPVKEHWKSLGLTFDAFYTGYLGSFEQIDIVSSMFDELSNDRTVKYVDPVMADAGKLYPAFGPEFPAGMRRLCEKADVIMPNLTELTLMLGEEWAPGPYTHEYVDSMLEKAGSFGVRKAVLTGVSFEEGMVGAVYRDFETGESGEVMREEIPGYYHGTGDVFGSALVGALESGLALGAAVEAAVNLTVGSILRTYESGADVRYGVDFEEGLRDYIAEVDSGRRIVTVAPVSDDDSLEAISGLANVIWNEAFDGMISQGQIDYMLEKYQSPAALKSQMAEDGYTYLLVEIGSRPIGYCGYVPDDEGLFLSKIYLLEGFRGRGISSLVLDRLKAAAREHGRDCIYLTVNRGNRRAIEVYEHMGFEVADTVDTPIGEGYFMNDYVMVLKV